MTSVLLIFRVVDCTLFLCQRGTSGQKTCRITTRICLSRHNKLVTKLFKIGCIQNIRILIRLGYAPKLHKISNQRPHDLNCSIQPPRGLPDLHSTSHTQAFHGRDGAPPPPRSGSGGGVRRLNGISGGGGGGAGKQR